MNCFYKRSPVDDTVIVWVNDIRLTLFYSENLSDYKQILIEDMSPCTVLYDYNVPCYITALY